LSVKKEQTPVSEERGPAKKRGSLAKNGVCPQKKKKTLPKEKLPKSLSTPFLRKKTAFWKTFWGLRWEGTYYQGELKSQFFGVKNDRQVLKCWGESFENPLSDL